MRSKTYPCGTTAEELADRFSVDKRDMKNACADLMREGYSIKGICYAAGAAEDKLTSFIGDTRFLSIMKNEVRKRAYKINDPRWDKKKK